MKTSFTTILESWREQKLRLLPAPEPQSLQQRFSTAGVALPSEIEAMYLLCGGMAENESDSRLFSLWPVDRVLNESKNFTANLVPFADGCFNAYAYLYRETPSGSVQVFADEHFSGEKAVLVANSLDEAFHFLVNEPRRLWLSHR